MSIETLRADLARNIANIPADPIAAVRELWAFLEAATEEMADIDASLMDMAEEADDILQPETAQLFLVVVQGCRACIVELQKRIKPETDEDKKMLVDLKTLDGHCAAALGMIEEITIAPDPDESEDDEPEGADAG